GGSDCFWSDSPYCNSRVAFDETSGKEESCGRGHGNIRPTTSQGPFTDTVLQPEPDTRVAITVVYTYTAASNAASGYSRRWKDRSPVSPNRHCSRRRYGHG